MTQQVVILGAGYIGLALGRQRLPGTDVVGVRRSAEGLDAVHDAGLTAVQADVTETATLTAVPDPDIVVFTASAGGRGVKPARDTYLEGQRTAIDHFGSRDDPPDRYIYTSSTGVYGDQDGAWVDETTALDPDTERGQILVEAERVALDRPREYGIDGTVARLAGLYGPGRYRLARYLDGPVTDTYLNMVHRDDVAGALSFLIGADVAREETVLVVDNEPVSKWTLATWLAEACDREPPERQPVAERLRADMSPARRRRIRATKRCSNAKLRDLGYEFSYPTYREGYAAAVEACEEV